MTPHDAAIAGGVGELDRQQRQALAGTCRDQRAQGVCRNQRHIAREHHHHAVVG
jgi:hypothetical protein